MPSQRKLDAARANGALAAGCKSPEGAARSAMNALKHGLAAHTVVLPGESHELFDEFADSLRDSLNPRTLIQHLLVQNVVTAAWRQRRYLAFETTAITVKAEEMRAEVDRRFNNADPQLRDTLAFQELIKDGQFRTFIRYDAHLDRQLHRALNRLENQPVEPQPANSPNEANPTNEQQPGPVPPPPHLPAFLSQTPSITEQEQSNEQEQTTNQHQTTDQHQTTNQDHPTHHDQLSRNDLPAPLIRTASGD